MTAEDFKNQRELEDEVPAIKNYFGLFRTYTPGCWSSPAYLTLTFNGISTFLHSRALSEDIRVIDSLEKLKSFIESIELNQLYIVIVKRGVLQDNRADIEEWARMGLLDDGDDVRSELEGNHAQTIVIKKTKLGDSDTVFIANYDCEADSISSEYCKELFKANVVLSNTNTIRQKPGGYHCGIYAISDAITLYELIHSGNYSFPNHSEQDSGQAGNFELDKSLVDSDISEKAQQYCQELVTFAKGNQHQEPANTNCSI